MGRRAAVRSPASLFEEPVGPDFRQERSRRSYQALLDAAESLFSAQGYDAVGTPEIAHKANVSVGTFYRYFDDKHEVYLEIVRRNMVAAYHATIHNLTPDRFAGKARRETIDQACVLLFAHVLDKPQLTRSLMEMSLRDTQVAEMRRAFDQLACQRLSELITAVTSRSYVPDPDAMAYVIYGAAMQCAYGLAVHLVPVAIDRDRARTALASFIERSLFPA
jgi:AcrR family transcriptional regulator